MGDGDGRCGVASFDEQWRRRWRSDWRGGGWRGGYARKLGGMAVGVDGGFVGRVLERVVATSGFEVWNGGGEGDLGDGGGGFFGERSVVL